jgi:hypothetical protein
MTAGTGFQTLAGVDGDRQRGGHRLVAAGTPVELDGAALLTCTTQ